MLPDKDYCERWANAQMTPVLRRVANKLTDAVTLIGEETYLNAAQALIQDFHQKVPEAPYVIVLAESDIEFEEGFDYWLYQQLIKLGIRAPESVLSRSDLEVYLRARPDLMHVLLVDDVVLSSRAQKKNLTELHQKLRRDDFTLHIGMPYLSTAAAAFFLAQTIFPHINLLQHQQLLLVKEHLSDSEKAYVDSARIGAFDESATLSYFEHHERGYKPIYFSPIERGRNLLEGLNARMLVDDFCRERCVELTAEGLKSNEQDEFDRFIRSKARLSYDNTLFLFPKVEEEQSEQVNQAPSPDKEGTCWIL